MQPPRCTPENGGLGVRQKRELSPITGGVCDFGSPPTRTSTEPSLSTPPAKHRPPRQFDGYNHLDLTAICSQRPVLTSPPCRFHVIHGLSIPAFCVGLLLRSSTGNRTTGQTCNQFPQDRELKNGGSRESRATSQ